MEIPLTLSAFASGKGATQSRPLTSPSPFMHSSTQHSIQPSVLDPALLSFPNIPYSLPLIDSALDTIIDSTIDAPLDSSPHFTSFTNTSINGWGSGRPCG